MSRKSDSVDERNVLSRFFHTCDRRTFLKAFGVLGLGAAGGGVIQALFDVVRLDRRFVKVSQTRLAMGTFVAITAVDSSRDRGEEAIGLAFEEMDRLIAILSRHDSRTAVSALNDAGALRMPPPELLDLVGLSLEFHRLSGGAFDITVKPILDAFRRTLGENQWRVPDRRTIEDALHLVGSEKIEITPSMVRFRQGGMGITLDGIAKGFIVDRISDVLADRGVENHLVNAGGDIRTRGGRSRGQPWTIAIEDPKKKGDYPAVIELTTGAVATSGNYEIYFDKEKLFHHIVDPHTGSSPHHSASATVVAESVTRADALSTAIFVMNPADGVRRIEALSGSECLVVMEDGERMHSKGWRAATNPPFDG